MADEFGPSLEPVAGGEFAEQMRGKFRPSISMPVDESIKVEEAKAVNPDFSELEKALRVIEGYLDKDHPFSNREIDVGARLIMTKLSGEEKSWIREIAERIHKRPLWHCFAGWFRFAQENSMAQAPVFDGSWDTRTSIDPNMTICILDECRKPFPPKVYGQKYCCKEHGAIADKRQIDKLLKNRPEGNPQIGV